MREAPGIERHSFYEPRNMHVNNLAVSTLAVTPKLLNTCIIP